RRRRARIRHRGATRRRRPSGCRSRGPRARAGPPPAARRPDDDGQRHRFHQHSRGDARMTIALDTRPAPRPITRRLWNIIRLHAANPFTVVGTPLIILGAIYAVNLVIWWMIRASTEGSEAVEGFSQGVQYSGAVLWIFVYMMIVAIQAMNLTF